MAEYGPKISLCICTGTRVGKSPSRRLFVRIHDSERKLCARLWLSHKNLSSRFVIRYGGPELVCLPPSACYRDDRTWALSPFSVSPATSASGRWDWQSEWTPWECVCVCVLGEQLSSPGSLSLRIRLSWVTWRPLCTHTNTQTDTHSGGFYFRVAVPNVPC